MEARMLPTDIMITDPRPLHIALYSHDTMGLGHTRRNLLIAQAISNAFPNADILMLTGARSSSGFVTPPRVDYLTLPSLHKDRAGSYEARELELSLKEIIKLRSRTIWAALKSFKPDVLIVDNVPKGAAGELERVLKKLKKKGRTRCVLGLRDVLDDAKAVRREWRKAGNEAIIDAYYDAVWVYGDPRVCDPVREYGLESLKKKLLYLGYFDPTVRLDCADATGVPLPELPEGLTLPGQEFVLCQVGGGQDGAHLALTFAQTDFPNGMAGVLVAGPYMPAVVRRQLHELAAERQHLTVLDFVTEPLRLLQSASRVIGMGGYNAVFEALAQGCPLLLVPRIAPRREQLIRAERLHNLGLLDYLEPDALTPQALSFWLANEPTLPYGVREKLNFSAMSKLPANLLELLPSSALPPTWEVIHAAA
jgi:predicted glycosyltransferase